MCPAPELVMDITALVGNALSGIQRVIFELVPRLAALAQGRGASVALAHSLEPNLRIIQRWQTPVSEEVIEKRLGQIQQNGASRDLLGELFLGAISSLVPRAITHRLSTREWRRKVKEFVLPRHGQCRFAVKPGSKLLAFSVGISPLHIPPEIASQDVVAILHDLIPAWHPEYVPAGMGATFAGRLSSLIMSEADKPGVRFIAPTDAAREEVLEFCWGCARRRPDVTAVPWGYNSDVFYPDVNAKLRGSLEIPEDGFLVLAVSSHDSRKRFGEIEGAICALAEEFPIYGIFTGIRPHTQTLNRNIRFMGHVADAELRQLYSTCDAYVNWSAAEGFGLPVVEALACGARVIVPHDTAALREVGGRHILSPTQTSRAGLIALLRELCQKRPPRAKIADLSAFNWDRSARSIDERLWRPTAQTKEIRLRIGA